MIEFFILTIAIIFLATASYTDFLKREVPDWLNYSTICFAFFIKIFWSFYSWNVTHFLYGVAGFFVFLAIGCLMYYFGQWGGGDAKSMMALGMLLGLELDLDSHGVMFLFNLLIVSLFYSSSFLLYLFVNNARSVVRKYSDIISKEKKSYRAVFIIMLLFSIINLFMPLDFGVKIIFFFVLASPLLYYLFAFIKSIELTSMQRHVEPELLTEGDWIVNDVIVDKRQIYSVKDLGVSKEQIKTLIRLRKQKKIDKILIKVGIPFVPCFFLTLIVNLYFGNVLIKIFQMLL